VRHAGIVDEAPDLDCPELGELGDVVPTESLISQDCGITDRFRTKSRVTTALPGSSG
jgi:hypothetical protein